MGIENMRGIWAMALDVRVIGSLFKIYRVLRDDSNFSLAKYVKMMRNMLKGEKIVKHEGAYIISTFLPPFPSKAFETNVMAVKSSKNIFTQQANAIRSAPISMYLSLTSRCPNNCIYCSEKNKQVSDELSTHEWIRAIAELQDMNTSIIGFTGGEPMTREDIYDIVGSVDDRSTAILFTSGFNLTMERARKLKESGLFGIGISLDSHEKEVHNSNRNSDRAYDYALEAIRNASDAGLYTMVQTVVSRENVNKERLFKLFELAAKSGAHEVKLLEPMPSGRLIDGEEANDIFLDESSRRRLVQIQHLANKRADFPKITSFAYTESRDKFGCGAGSQHSYISSSGELYPCDFVPMSFGNVREEGVSSLWEHMNKICGIPRTSCLSRSVNAQLLGASNGVLPLNMDSATELLKGNKSKEFPKYYADMQ